MKKMRLGIICVMLCTFLACSVSAGILSTISGTAQIQPMNDGSGKYMLKSSGFYCLDENGAASAAEIHYFDHYEIDGTVFQGYYYHDADGLFRAGLPQLIQIKNLSGLSLQTEKSEETGEEILVQEKIDFNGIFQVGNLGKMSGAPRVLFLEEEKVGDTVLNGYYYINENGRLIQEPGIFFLQMTCNGRSFDGYYYFGGANGALSTEAGVTPEGYLVDDSGRLAETEEIGMQGLGKQLRSMLEQYQGRWSVYVKNLSDGDELVISEQSMGSASVIKLFVMAATYDNMKNVLENQATLLNLPSDDPKVKEKIDKLLWNMITISDNEAYNELVRLQTAKHDFKHGARFLNVYLEEEGYIFTRVRHTLQPSGSPNEGIGDGNTTSAAECGNLLEKIYRRECVSPEASDEMLNLLLNQKVNWKLRAGLPEGVVCANKSGENSSNQHDVGIVFGEQKDYIICVLSEDYGNENLAFDEISDLSRTVYAYTNRWFGVETVEKQETSGSESADSGQK